MTKEVSNFYARDLDRVGAVKYHLKTLVAKGDVKFRNFRNSESESGYIYVVSPRGLQKRGALQASSLKRKRQQYYAMRVDISELHEELSKNENRTTGVV